MTTFKTSNYSRLLGNDESATVIEYWAPLALTAIQTAAVVASLRKRDDTLKITEQSVRAELQRLAATGFLTALAGVKPGKPDLDATRKLYDNASFLKPLSDKPKRATKRTVKTRTELAESAGIPETDLITGDDDPRHIVQ